MLQTKPPHHRSQSQVASCRGNLGMNHSKFEVVSFENRNGTNSWRVVGWLHGERVQKNFKTRAEAVAEKAMWR